MNRLEEADIHLGGKGSVFDMLCELGNADAQYEMFEKQEEQREVESLKTTSVRMSENQLNALDAICKALNFTRQDAIRYAVGQFIGDAVAGYAIGRASAFAQNDETFAGKELTAFINGLGLDDNARKYVSNLATEVFAKEMGLI